VNYERTTTGSNQLFSGIDLGTVNQGSVPNVDAFKSTFITYGFLVNQRFDYADLAGFTVGLRADKSSAFGEGADYAFFPRADAYFRLSGLSFWKPLSETVTDFKVRGAFGGAGTQPGAYDRQPVLITGLIGVQGTLNTPGTAANPLLLVEESQEFEYGTDLAFKFGRSWFSNISLSATYWNRENNGAIQSLETPPSVGATLKLDNAIDLSSDGFDLSLTSLNYYSKDFNWRTTINFGKAQTTIDRIANGNDLILSSSANANYIFREGERFGVVYGIKALRSLDEVNEAGERYIDAADEDNFTFVDGVVVNKATKRIQYRDYQQKIADPTPDFSMSFINNFNIAKNLNIGFQIDWVYGNEIYNETKSWMYGARTHGDFDKGVVIDNGERIGQPIDPANPAAGNWTYNGNEPQAYDNYHGTKRNGVSEFFVEDGSFVKLRELSISYDLADILGFRKKKWAQNVIVGVTGRNLLVFTNYSGFDPEVSQDGQDTRFRGLDTFTFPNYRTVSMNLSINF
jgi:hypothetical protein